MKGIVTCVRQSASSTYTVLTMEGKGIEARELKSDFALNPGELVEVDYEGPVPTEGQEDLPIFVREMNRRISGIVEERLAREAYATGIRKIDDATERMWERLRAAAGVLLRKLMLGSPVIVRFHNDADGSSGAVGLHKGITKLLEEVKAKPNIVWIMHRGVTYSERDAESDVLVANGYSSMEKPLLVIIDFGTSAGSNEGIEAIGERMDVVWLDHHPVEEGFDGVRLENYINPWRFGSDSGYTAGLFACAFSHTFADPDTREMESASLVGDYSRFAPKEGPGLEVATILDLITSDPKIVSRSDSNVTPSEIESALNNAGRRSELYNYARMRLEEALDAAFISMRPVRTEKADLFILDYGEMRSSDSRYPLPGRFSSRLLGRIEEVNGRPSMVIVHFNAYISMRVSGEISDLVDIPGLIARMKALHPEAIESGGGHKNAASIKLSDEGGKREVLRALTEAVKERLRTA